MIGQKCGSLTHKAKVNLGLYICILYLPLCCLGNNPVAHLSTPDLAEYMSRLGPFACNEREMVQC